jgi:small subunit ribosomal protein S21
MAPKKNTGLRSVYAPKGRYDALCPLSRSHVLRKLSNSRSINRWIKEEHHVQVFVRDNNVDQALRALKKKMQREGLFREMKLRKHYEKPSEKRVREKAEAVRRARKLARKRLQREGLLPTKPRAIQGTVGRAGPARAPRF